MMSDKNKNRLFLTAQHRGSREGYHLAILLAPKEEKVDELDSYMFHAVNSALQPTLQQMSGIPPWRFEVKKVNSKHSRSLFAKVLVAKLPTGSIHEQAVLIQDILEQVPLIQNDPTYDCRIWPYLALEALRKSESGYFATIPLTVSVEQQVIDYVDKAMLKYRTAALEGKGFAVQHVDMRQREILGILVQLP
ncbi:hypothetical protein B0H34DRAFT_266278 [Crassisporium funariophilum]|nr:hypothetical protein B0H34DRAFT_266278 [Crassisporium funariophilum]